MSDELETAVSESIPADAASAASAPESAPAKPKRATTRKKAASAVATADASEGASTADAPATKVVTAAAEGDTLAVKKPATRKRTTAAKKTPAKTAAAADTETAVKASATETPAPAESAGEAASTALKKPAARKTTATRTRRKIAPAEAESPAAAETAPEAASDAAASASATVGANVASAVAPEEAANTSETPARMPRARTRTKAASGARSGAKKPAASRAKDAESSSDAAPLAPIEFSSDADVIATETLADPSLTAGQSPKGNGASAAEVLSVEVLVTDAPQSAASEVLIEASAEASSAEGSPEPAAPNRVRRERNNGANNGDRSNNERNDNNNKKRSKQNQNQNQNQGSSDKSNGQNQQGQNNQNQNKANNKGSFDRDHRRQRRQHGSREVLPSISRDELAEMKVGDLREKAAEYSIDASGYRKAELVDVVFEALCKAEGIIEVTGILDIMNDGYGFLRAKGYLPSEGDAYVSLSIIRRNGLRKGDYVVGLTRPAQGNEKYAAIQKVISVNDTPADELGGRVRFADLTPIYPDERLIMEHGKSTTTARVIDLVSPIGKGQRGLIVSPPKAGKTTVLKDIAAAISANNPEVHLMCLLVDERPEEVTDMERSIKGEVISSTFDKPCENHIAVAELVIERAKRLVEQGRDVVILLDSITRLARAYNMGTPASGRILSGGVDSSALYPPKRFLGAARNIENGGSLTILGTALVDTGSKMDEVIFEEFKGTGNMELRLDRTLADKRIFPAIDPITSGTRKEELLLDPQEAPLIWAVRRVLANLNNTERAMDTLVKSIKQTETNQEFLIRFARKAQNSSKQDSLDL